MKLFSIATIVLVLVWAAAAQKPDDVLATATGHVFHVSDLPADIQKLITELPSRIAKSRTDILGQIVNQKLLDMEARSQNISPSKLVANERAKVPNPSEADIKAIYDANRKALGDQTPEQARKVIVEYLRGEPERTAMAALFANLKTKYKVAKVKDVNAADLSPADVVATVGEQPVTAKEFEAYARIQIAEGRQDVADQILDDLNETIYDALVLDEAKAQGIDASTLIAHEISDKLKTYSDEEREGLTTALRNKLTAKYQVKIVYKRPDPLVQNISVDDDPATGPANAPVTIVMFGDFQCSACGAAHPILKSVIAEYPGKIRLVERDFPLESIHENAYNAARAAGAANAQGKYFEYGEILYKNQEALDVESLKKYAAQIGLNVKQFELDFNSEKTVAEIRKDIADGESYGINSTPSIFVNGVRVRNLSAEAFREAINRALKK
jgi:protein-disulfide isomerase